MLESLKRLFVKRGVERDLADVAEWARRRGHGFKRVRGEDGFVVDGKLDGMDWRLEWGPPQRDYILGHELRLRMELALPPEMQMLVLSRVLMEALERATYEQFTDSTQTQIGDTTPEEMRWLVMFPKVELTTMKSLRTRFGAVASVPAAGQAWIEGPLADVLVRSADTLLRSDPPFVLMTLRGRAYLRMLLDTPDPKALAAALGIFEIAAAQALAVANRFGGTGSGWPSSATTAWQSLRPDETEDLGKPR